MFLFSLHLLLVWLYTCFKTITDFFSRKLQKNGPISPFPVPFQKLIAHRGFTLLHLENTIEAFKDALIHKFNWIEMDIQITTDDELVVFHDDDTSRMMESPIGFVIHKSPYFGILDKLKMANKYSIPRLWDVFEEVSKNNNQIVLNLELKIPENLESKDKTDYRKRLVKNFMELIENFIGPSDPYLVISSFDLEILKMVYQSRRYASTSSKLRYALLFDEIPEETSLDDIRIDYVGISNEIIDIFPKKSSLQRILIYTINDKYRMEEVCEDDKVCGIFSDEIYPI
jgi:glycerophosphoryl diester phosphodiesterase